MNFLERAKITTAIGAPVIRLHPRAKNPIDSDWPALATIDLQIIEKWNFETPEANCAAVAKAEIGGVWFFEFDSPTVPERIQATTGRSLTEITTFKVRSSPGKGHIYFKQSAASIAMGNIGQAGGLDWSARVDRQFVVSSGSIHPISGHPYEIRMQAELSEAPSWLLDWCISQRPEKKIAVPIESNALVFEGGRNVWLTSIAGKDRANGLEHEEILNHIRRVNQEQCTPPLSDSEVEVIANSIARYAAGKPNIILFDGIPVGTKPHIWTPTPQPIVLTDEEETVALPPMVYPKFPDWMMKGTSIYEGLVKPFCDVNTRYPEFMFMPAVTLLLNYVGTKVRVDTKDLIPSIFMVSIGRAGRVIKSTCVQDAIKYFEYMGCVAHSRRSDANANGKALIFSAGSPEGLGKEMNRLNCRNGIVFYDELSTLTNKAGIENSALGSTLLTLYESGLAQNQVKNPKDHYELLPGTYCASLIACCTDKNFSLNWSRLAGGSTGLNDRFFFLFQPQVLKEIEPYVHVNTQETSVKTLQLIQKAVAQGVYKIADNLPFKTFLNQNQDSNRAEIRAEKFALYFAIDLGLDEIEETCIERAIALSQYELDVKKYIRVYEAFTKEGGVQQEARYQLQKLGGAPTKREFERVMHPERYGTKMWNDVYIGLIKAGWIKEQGSGVKGDPIRVVLLRLPDEDD